ncbi:MAG: hypothetical protein LBR60_04295 [Fibrobacter sp.]|jgi:hypothetical protein|nr:hypothetical protein [Fibrobacter sp.]
MVVEIGDILPEIQRLEKNMNFKDAAEAWERGRNDAIADLRRRLFPENSDILNTAEIAFRVLVQKYGNIFSYVFAGFNPTYDEPTILLALNKENENRRSDISWFSTFLEFALHDGGFLPLSIMITRESSTDLEVVRSDMEFKREVNAKF